MPIRRANAPVIKTLNISYRKRDHRKYYTKIYKVLQHIGVFSLFDHQVCADNKHSFINEDLDKCVYYIFRYSENLILISLGSPHKCHKTANRYGMSKIPLSRLFIV